MTENQNGSNEVIYSQDGNMRQAVRPGFVNLQESPAGFGATDEEALNDLIRHEHLVSPPPASYHDVMTMALRKLSEQEPIARFFLFAHLPDKLKLVSARYADMAIGILGEGGLPRSAERTVALRKLLESKDAAVRAAL